MRLIKLIENMYNYIDDCFQDYILKVDEMRSSEREYHMPRKTLVAKTSNSKSNFHIITHRYKQETFVFMDSHS